MNDVATRKRGHGLWIAVGAVVCAAIFLPLVAGVVFLGRYLAHRDDPPPLEGDVPAASAAEVRTFCGACHQVPPPDSFPRSAWPQEVGTGYTFFEKSKLPLQPPPFNGVVKYYQDRAPEALPPAKFEEARTPLPVRFARTDFPGPPKQSPNAISNINLVHLFDDKRLDVLACDMRWGQVMALRPYEKDPTWQVLGEVPNPCHTQVIDLDGDGIKDVLVANLGSFTPTDRHCGSVVWLRGSAGGKFTPIPLLENVGRVADVEAADFRGVGKLDLIVAVFGWQQTGEILYLENQTEDWAHPKFVKRVLDTRHGGIHVPVADLNGDGKPDFVALISQEHETVVAFLNQGNGQFRKEVIYTAPHPAYGSSGIELVDMDGDGDLDVLYTNGDVLDEPYLLKPYHSVQWLENRGSYPFVHHPITPMYGVHRAVAADFTGTGKKLKDVAAVSFLPIEGFPQRQELNPDGVIFLEQTGRDQFARHSLEKTTCDHVTCAAGDIYGTGRVDLVTGVFTSVKTDHVLTIWKNLGAPPAGDSKP